MKFERLQVLVSRTAADAIRAAATRERLTVSEYLRRVVDQHLEGDALIDPVRVAFADATSQVLQLATDSFGAATEQLLADVRAEREQNHKQIADFVAMLESTFNPKPAEPVAVRAPDRPIK
jgi:hypothetical protein